MILDCIDSRSLPLLCYAVLCVPCRIVITHVPAGQGLTTWLSCVLCFLVFLSLSYMMSRVSCGT